MNTCKLYVYIFYKIKPYSVKFQQNYTIYAFKGRSLVNLLSVPLLFNLSIDECFDFG